MNMYTGTLNAAQLLFLISAIIVFPVQLLLCFRAKSRWIRLLPLTLFLLLFIASFAAILIIGDWEAFVYVIFAICAGYMMLISGTGWLIWAIARFIAARKTG